MVAGSATAISHKVILANSLEVVLPYLTKHDYGWNRDRRLHNHIGKKWNPFTPVRGCSCCDAMSYFGGNSCPLCLAARTLSLVCVNYKLRVRAYGSKLHAWWWVWPAEHRAAKRASWKAKNNRPRAGYEPQEADGSQGHQALQDRVPNLDNENPWAGYMPGPACTTNTQSTQQVGMAASSSTGSRSYYATGAEVCFMDKLD